MQEIILSAKSLFNLFFDLDILAFFQRRQILPSFYSSG